MGKRGGDRGVGVIVMDGLLLRHNRAQIEGRDRWRRHRRGI